MTANVSFYDSRRHRVDRLRRFESALYWVLLGLMATAYAYFSFFSEANWFGFHQLRRIGLLPTVSCLALVGLILIIRRSILFYLRRLNRWLLTCTRRHRLLSLIFAALLFGFVFFLLRNEFINPDGLVFKAKFLNDIPVRGAHVTHDEMLELYLHSRFWFYTNALFGWSVTFSYQVLSCIGGAVFIFVLAKFIGELFPNRAGLLFVGIISGGYMQLFFGDVENYTLVSVLILVYLYLGHLYLNGRCGVVAPGIILALAMAFHLLAGWLLPSLGYLYWISLKRREIRPVLLSAVTMVILLAATIVFFHFNGLPLRELYYHSHAFGHGGDINRQFVDISWNYYLQVINLLFLLFPPAVFFILLLVNRRISKTPEIIFLLFASAFFLIFMFVWKAMLGVYDDWNLFAPAAIPLSLLFWLTLTRADSLKGREAIMFGIIVLSFMHSYSWIITNHFH